MALPSGERPTSFARRDARRRDHGHDHGQQPRLMGQDVRPAMDSVLFIIIYYRNALSVEQYIELFHP